MGGGLGYKGRGIGWGMGHILRTPEYKSASIVTNVMYVYNHMRTVPSLCTVCA